MAKKLELPQPAQLSRLKRSFPTTGLAAYRCVCFGLPICYNFFATETLFLLLMLYLASRESPQFGRPWLLTVTPFLTG